MPALPSVPKVVKIQLDWTIGEDLFARSRFFHQYSGTAPTNTQLNTFCAAVATAYSADVKGAMTGDRVLTQVQATDLSSPTSAVGSDAVSIAGTDTSATMPASTGVLVSREVGRRYRGGHPRIYLPAGAGDVKLDAQNWTSTFIAAFQTSWDSFVAAINAAGWSGAGTIEAVNVSYYSGFTNHTGTTGRTKAISTVRSEAVVDVVTSDIIRSGIASQRKRLLRLA